MKIVFSHYYTVKGVFLDLRLVDGINKRFDGLSRLMGQDIDER